MDEACDVSDLRVGEAAALRQGGGAVVELLVIFAKLLPQAGRGPTPEVRAERIWGYKTSWSVCKCICLFVYCLCVVNIFAQATCA